MPYVLYWMGNYCLRCLQLVQNSAAQCLMISRLLIHFTLILTSPHWLPVTFTIDFRIILITFKPLSGQAPSYIGRLLNFSFSGPLSGFKIQIQYEGGWSFCSSGTQAVEPSCDVRTADSVGSFKSCPKSIFRFYFTAALIFIFAFKRFMFLFIWRFYVLCAILLPSSRLVWMSCSVCHIQIQFLFFYCWYGL